VPVVLLTGFLGTGKTTLLKHWLENSEGRIGVVVNDVASVNIDAKLVNREKTNARGRVDTIQLENGCACCSLGDELLVTIYDLVQLAEEGEPFSHIIVELSGVAEPKRVRENFEMAEVAGSEVVDGVELSKVVTLMDASTFCTDYMAYSRMIERPDLMEEDCEQEVADVKVVELLVEQLEGADVVVLNKTDLADAERLDATRAVVGALNEKASVFQTSFGRVPLSTVLAEPEPPAADAAHEDHGHQAEGHAHAEHGHEEHGHEAGGHSCGEHGHEEHGGHGHAERGHGHEEGCGDPQCSDPSHGHSHEQCEDPQCTDPTHDHSHGHSHSSITTAQERFGITSFIYRARRPFHDERLKGVLARWPVPTKDCLGQVLADAGAGEGASPFTRVIRSKGFCWLETYPSSRMYWSHAGKSLALDFDNFWWDALTESQLRMLGLLADSPEGDYARARREDWTEEWGDRRQELVFIGQSMDEAGIRAALDECLVREGEELEAYRARQGQDAAASQAFAESPYAYEDSPYEYQG